MVGTVRYMKVMYCGLCCQLVNIPEETFGMTSYLYLKVVHIPHLDGCDQVSLRRRMIDYPFHSTQHTPFSSCKVGSGLAFRV